MKNTLHTPLSVRVLCLYSHHWYVSPCSLCVSSRFLCVVTATVTRESGGYRRKET